MKQCLARRPDLSKTGRELFQGGINHNGTKRLGYVTEKRCSKKIASRDLCDICMDIRINDRNPKECAGNLGVAWYGLVTEPISSNYSFGGKYIFGGTEWLKDAATYGISQEALEKGIAAHNDAVKGLNGVPPLPDMSAMVKKEVTEPPPKKEKKAKKGVEVAAPEEVKLVKELAQTSVLEAINQPVTVEAPLVVPPPQVEVKKRTYKKKVATTTSLPQPVAILSEEKPVDVDNVETIEVVAKELNGTNYYLDTRKSKVYNPKNGLCVGLWDSVREIIVPHDDSDVE
jgi:hypothetical protein